MLPAAESTVMRFAQLWGISEGEFAIRSLAMVEIYYPYNAFVDESRQSRFGPAIYGVAAFVATFDRWLELEQRWREILHKFEVPLDGKPDHTEPFFHMTDFIARQKQFANDWSNDKRNEFIELLSRTAADHTVVGVACCVNEEEYQRVLPADIQEQFKKPHFFCIWGVLSSLAGLESRWSIALPTPLWFLFDRKKKSVEHAARVFYTTKQLRANAVLGEMGFGSMWNTPQLQATDLLVYEAVRRSAEERHDATLKARPPLQQLSRKGNLFIIHMDEERLSRYVELAREAEKVAMGGDDDQ